MKIVLIIYAMLLVLAGCSSAIPIGHAFDPVDVASALQIAIDTNDQDGLDCVNAIRLLPTYPPLDPKGPLSLFMAAREIRRNLEAGPDKAVRRACAPLVLDAEETVLKLGISATPGGGFFGGLLRQ